MTGDPKETNRAEPDAGGVEDEVPGTMLIGMPLSVLRRVRALKKLQLSEIDLEVKFHDRINQLEKEFQPLFAEVNNKRKAIVTGEHEPEEGECEPLLIHGLSKEDNKAIEERAPRDENAKGIPGFWRDVLLNCTDFDDLIAPDDLPVLKHLIDITSEVDGQHGFTLSFHFGKNPYFTNQVLKKTYVLKNAPDASKPFDYDGPTIHTAKGEPISWIAPHTGPKGDEDQSSFFRFFDPALKKYSDKMDEDEEDAMQRDYDIALHIRDLLIPKAVLYLTDEITQDGSSWDDTVSDSSSSGEDDDDMAGGDDNGKLVCKNCGEKQADADLDDSMTGGGGD